MKQVLISEELLEQVLADVVFLSRLANVDHNERPSVAALRATLEQPAPPADVPMLTEEEIWNSDELIAGNAIAGLMLNDYAAVVRIIEAVVRQKAGLK